MSRNAFAWVVSLLAVAASARGIAAPLSGADVPRATPRLLRELNRGAETVPVIIGVRDGTPSARALIANPDPQGEPARRQLRLAAQKRLADEMTAGRLQVTHNYESFSMLAGTATREAAIALASHPDVAWVDIDRQARALQTTPQTAQTLMRSDLANNAGFTGAGQTVAILDTGIDPTVSNLGGGPIPNAKVIGGKDVADNDDDPTDCEGHGTEVAGVFTLVAPGAKIVAIKVFKSTTPANNASCSDTTQFSTIFAGLDFAVANKAKFGITIANISLGGDFEDTNDHGYCDADDPASASAIESATAAGVIVVAASGNEALTNQISLPACISLAVSVGAVYADNRTRVSWADDAGGVLCTDSPATADGVICFSNSTTSLTILGPGAFWGVQTKGGSIDNSFAGTSASTPAVSGAIALIRQRFPALPPTSIVAILRSTGKPITDPRNGVVTPRVDALAAVQLDAASFATSTTTAVAIPDGTGSATATATVSGVTRPMASVQVWVEIDHADPQQLRLTLTGPDGTSAVLRDQSGSTQHPINAIYGKTDASAQSLGVFAGKLANGVWTLKVEDLVPGSAGRIRTFSVTIIPGQPIEAIPAGVDGRTLPVVAHTPGTKLFLSDVRLYNPGPAAKTFSLFYVGAGQTGTTASKDTRTVGPGQVLALNDVIVSEYNFADSIGQMTATGPDPGFIITSRAYNVSDNGTFGLFIPGLRTSGGITAASGKATANGLAQTATFHTNVGFTEVSGFPVTVHMDILDSAGNLLASRESSTGPYTTVIIPFIISDRGLPSTTNFRVDFSVVSATGRVHPFATYVDNVTGDGSFQAAANPAFSADDIIVAQTSHVTGANSDFFKTDLDITNLDTKPVTVTVSLIPLLLTGTPAPPRVYVIAPGQTLEKLDVLATEFGLGDPSAAGLRIRPVGPARLAVSTRTYVAKFGGTFGFSVPGVFASTALGPATTATVIQLDQTSSANGYRSNFGFTEVAGADVAVRVFVRSGDTGVVLGSKAYFVPANTSFQANVQDILGAGVTASNIYLQFGIESGAGKVVPYAGVVDNKAGDAIFMIAE